MSMPMGAAPAPTCSASDLSDSRCCVPRWTACGCPPTSARNVLRRRCPRRLTPRGARAASTSGWAARASARTSRAASSASRDVASRRTVRFGRRVAGADEEPAAGHADAGAVEVVDLVAVLANARDEVRDDRRTCAASGHGELDLGGRDRLRDRREERAHRAAARAPRARGGAARRRASRRSAGSRD